MAIGGCDHPVLDAFVFSDQHGAGGRTVIAVALFHLAGFHQGFDAALIAIQAKQLGLNVPLFGGDGWESEKLTEIGKESVEGHYFSTHYSPEVGSDMSKQFVENYRKRWNGKNPDALAACGYDSALVLVDAIKRAGTTEGAKVREALAATKDFKAVTGNITINAQRDASKAAVILQVKDGKFKYLETVEP